MTIYDLTLTPNEVSSGFLSNTAVSGSWATGAAQTVARGGQRWRLGYTYRSLTGSDRAEMIALLAEMDGQANRLRVPVYDNPARGAYGGTPLVDGGSQTGSTINVKGCSLNITNWIRRGDMFSVIVNGEPELKLCTADASSDGSGDISALTFRPPLRAAPSDGAAIYVNDNVLSVPKGIFIIDAKENSWRSAPNLGGSISDFSLEMVEDVFATQT